MAIDPSPIGFEGFEKRLEITFSHTLTIFKDPTKVQGLRNLTRPQLDSILEPACCTIVAQVSNTEFDSYVLSESSLFVYPLKIILKTCGTTKLLLSIPKILQLATESLSLTVSNVKYSRGSFIFPSYQPAPHRSFTEEVAALNQFFGELNAEAYFIGDPNDRNRDWHIYSATEEISSKNQTDEITVEMCMTGLDKKKAAVFFKKSEEHTDACEMTKMSGISDIIPSHVICDFEFDPCGYSMNGIEDSGYSTVHVTPEDGFSYASYEAMGFDPSSVRFEPLVKRVLKVFGPSEFSVAVTCRGGSKWWALESGDVEGYYCEKVVKQELVSGGCLVYKTYAALDTPTKVTMQCRKEVAEVESEVVVCRCIS
ncbi:SAM_decarbox domain-containing protein [Cephalotus follicularis]|uniref:S-adenosylmethionine decarboxylase proenzyme n=1 Tax=Cephalotus follicularis TaxID=3775 RepID=A0A1Q3C419_CEPFO|nr:SAM_decarbox domain-containing protein [Cephalotus follicularis]